MLLLDASTSMKPAWEHCVAALPVLLSTLQPGDKVDVVLFGEGAEVAVRATIDDSASLGELIGDLTRIKCDRKGSKLSAGLAAASEVWSGVIPNPAVLLLLTDGIVFPPTGPKHEQEGQARWNRAKAFRQDAELQRVLLGVKTEEQDGKSLTQVEKLFAPTAIYSLGHDDLDQFQTIMTNLRQVVEEVRVPAPTPRPTPAQEPQPTPRPCPWALYAGAGLLALGLGVAGVLAALRASRESQEAREALPPVAILRVTAWELDDSTFARVGQPQRWRFEVPARGQLTVKLGNKDHKEADCPVDSAALLGTEPLTLVVDAKGLRRILVPNYERVLVKDEALAFNDQPRCLAEEIYQPLTAGANPLAYEPQGSDLLLRLPGENEVRLQWCEVVPLPETGHQDSHGPEEPTLPQEYRPEGRPGARRPAPLHTQEDAPAIHKDRAKDDPLEQTSGY